LEKNGIRKDGKDFGLIIRVKKKKELQFPERGKTCAGSM
jgi:hypothetical protein